MKNTKSALTVAGLMILGFCLYVTAPLTRSYFERAFPVVLAAQDPSPANPCPSRQTTTPANGEPVQILQPSSVAGPWTKTVLLRPGRAVQITNSRFRVLEFHTNHPIAIDTPGCETHFTFDFRCTLDSPMDIFIRDIRSQSERGINEVKITVQPD